MAWSSERERFIERNIRWNHGEPAPHSTAEICSMIAVRLWSVTQKRVREMGTCRESPSHKSRELIGVRRSTPLDLGITVYAALIVNWLT